MSSTFDIFSIKTVPPTYSWDKGTPNLDYTEFITELSSCTLSADNELGIEYIGYAPFSFICLSSAPGEISNSHLAIKRTADFGDYYNHQTNLVSTPTLSNELFCHAYIMPGKYDIEYTKTEYIEVMSNILPAFGVCLQKHCLDWTWKNLNSTNTTALSVTWKKTKPLEIYEKKWKFEACENDWAALNGLHLHRLEDEGPQLLQWYNYKIDSNKNRYNNPTAWATTGFQQQNQLVWSDVGSPCIYLRQFEQVIWRWDNISNGIVPDPEPPECFLQAVVDTGLATPFTQEDNKTLLGIPCEEDTDCTLTILVSGQEYALFDDLMDNVDVACANVVELSCLNLTILNEGEEFNLFDDRGDILYLTDLDNCGREPNAISLIFQDGDQTFNLFDQEGYGDGIHVMVEPPLEYPVIEPPKKALDTRYNEGRNLGIKAYRPITWDETKLSNPYNITWDYVRDHCVTTLAPMVSSNIQKITKKQAVRIIEIPPQTYLTPITLENRTAPLTIQLTPRYTVCGSFPIEKIVWDLGDGSPLLTQRRWANTLETPFIFTGAIPEDFEDPRNFDVKHTYIKLPEQGYSYYPSITAYASSTNSTDCAACIVGPLKNPSSIEKNIQLVQTDFTNDNGKVLVGQIENNIAIWRADK